MSPSNGSVYLRVVDKDGGEVAADLLIAGPGNIQARGVEQLADGSVAVLYTDYAGSSTSSGNAHSFLARVDGTTVTQLADLGAGSIYPRLQATDDGLFVAWNSQAAGAPRQGMMQEFGLDGTAVSGPVSISPAYADTADLTSTYSGVSSSLVDTADISVHLTKFAVSDDVAGSVLVYRGQDSLGDNKAIRSSSSETLVPGR